MRQIEDRSIEAIVENAYATYGEYVNLNRHIPNMLDGLKPVYRKAIYAVMKACGDGIKDAATVMGEAAKYYSHNPLYLVDVMCILSKYGILQDVCNNGTYFIHKENDGHAAFRYLITGIEPFWNKLFGKLINYVPYTLSDKGTNEPDYIPTPIPLGLIFGYSSMSCGCNTEIPPFTAQSMLDALINDDPRRLKLSFGLEIVQDKTNINGIWENGAGKLTFKYPWKVTTIESYTGILISGNAIYQNLNWNIEDKNKRAGFDYTLDKLIESNIIEVIEISSDKVPSVFFRIKDERRMTLKELGDFVDFIVTNYRLIKLTVYYKSSVSRISLKTWLQLSFNNYNELLEKYRKENIDRLIRNRTILENLPAVAKVLVDNHGKDISNQWIADQLKIEKWIVDEVVKKPISALKKKDTSNEINSINDQIAKFEAFDPVSFTTNAILEIPE